MISRMSFTAVAFTSPPYQVAEWLPPRWLTLTQYPWQQLSKYRVATFAPIPWCSLRKY